jgi:hypothetical protein
MIEKLNEWLDHHNFSVDELSNISTTRTGPDEHLLEVQMWLLSQAPEVPPPSPSDLRRAIRQATYQRLAEKGGRERALDAKLSEMEAFFGGVR